MEKFDGYLFCKLHLIGSRSEGPRYFIQQFDYVDIVVRKKVHSHEEDPTLHKFLAKKVTISGKMTGEGIDYEDIAIYQPPRKKAQE